MIKERTESIHWDVNRSEASREIQRARRFEDGTSISVDKTVTTDGGGRSVSGVFTNRKGDTVTFDSTLTHSKDQLAREATVEFSGGGTVGVHFKATRDDNGKQSVTREVSISKGQGAEAIDIIA